MTNQSFFLSKILTLLVFSCFCATHSLAADRLYQGGDALNSSKKLISAFEFFTLGFIGIAPDGYSNYSYLGIWRTYNDRSQIQPVWLANRGKPIADVSGVNLVIDEKGNMKLTYSGGGRDLIVLYSSLSSTTNLTAVLEDSGNFVLKDANNRILWQSFDYPTDTFLSGMKLGINHRTGQTWVLTSRLSDSVPALGAFTFEWEPRRQELVIKRRDWELKFDGGITEIQSNGRYYFGGVLCDGNNTEMGCVKWDAGPICRSRDRFELTTISYNTSTFQTVYDDNASLSIGDCKNICWNDCACFGVQVSNTGCILQYGNYSKIPVGLPTQVHYMIVRQTQPGTSHGASHGEIRNWIWIVIFVAPVMTMALAGILWYLRRRRLREMFLNELMTLDGANDMHELENDGNRGNNLKVYSAAIIMAATNSFSEGNKLGQGGFGPVYKGKLSDGREVAIKRLSRNSGQGLVEFKNELILIAKLQHMNLVKLLGYCIQGEDKMLVYEFMPNKSLDSFIYDQSKRELLDWKERFKIIEGIVQGLLYLHQYSRLRIIHRDLKASNILLDENLNPKISDFGMARIFKTNELQANTNRIVGTYGYMSPEYAMEGTFSVKSDVFSFGVLVLEIVAGRKNRDLVHIDPPLNLVGYAWELWKEGNQFELADPTLRDSCSKDQVSRCIHVGLLCLEDNAKDRPTTSDVLSMLTSEAPLPLPKQPAFSNIRNIMDMTELNSSKAGSSSINNVSISIMEAR